VSAAICRVSRSSIIGPVEDAGNALREKHAALQRNEKKRSRLEYRAHAFIDDVRAASN
jgi:hypothetical protein